MSKCLSLPYFYKSQTELFSLCPWLWRQAKGRRRETAKEIPVQALRVMSLSPISSPVFTIIIIMITTKTVGLLLLIHGLLAWHPQCSGQNYPLTSRGQERPSTVNWQHPDFYIRGVGTHSTLLSFFLFFFVIKCGAPLEDWSRGYQIKTRISLLA